MIKKAILSGTPCFANQAEINPAKVNFIFGANGTGKSTLARILCANPNMFACEVQKSSDDCRILTYNKEFVETMFSDSSKIRGVYTFGKDSAEAANKIVLFQREISELSSSVQGLTIEHKKAEEDHKKVVKEFRDSCWKIKEKYQSRLSKILRYANSKADFADNIVTFVTSVARSGLSVFSGEEMEQTIKEWELICSGNLSVLEPLPTLPENGFTDADIHLMAEVITGRKDLNISSLISHLRNADWINMGREYLDSSNGLCPFCQAELTESFVEQLCLFFDDEYKSKIESLNKLLDHYKKLMSSLIALKGRLTDCEDLIDTALLHAELQKLESHLTGDINALSSKIEHPSVVYHLVSLDSILKAINIMILKTNEMIEEHNWKVNNWREEEKRLKTKLKALIYLENEALLKAHSKQQEDHEKKVAGLCRAIQDKNCAISQLRQSISKEREKISNITETVEAINKLLKDFDFHSFHLEETEEDGFYRIVRPDKTDVGDSLSDGEARFISFLYFYSCIGGSFEKNSAHTRQIIVIDDPVSSLDSKIMFGVSSLIKELVSLCLKNEKGIAQVFVLTHNVFFHKEVAGQRLRGKLAKELRYFMLKKGAAGTVIDQPNENPIKSTYAMMWKELNNPASSFALYNTMRRILEYYFNFIGGVDYESCINKFTGRDKLICKSLITCINQNSHDIPDDISFSESDSDIAIYSRVFESIFDLLGHAAHYRMMKGIGDDSDDGSETPETMDQGGLVSIA